MTSPYSPAMAPPMKKRARFVRCACCGGRKEREETPWKAGDPPVCCGDCKVAGCTHRWAEWWNRGENCPARLRGKRLRACAGSAGGRSVKR